jgi:hypothetical protein
MNTNPSGTKTDALAYTMLRQAVGYLGIFLPFVLMVGGWWFFHTRLQGSISDYHYTGMRDVHVGALWVIGFFLLSYHGPDGPNSIDDWAGNAACFFAVVASLFATDKPGGKESSPSPILGIPLFVWGIIVLLFLLTVGFLLYGLTRSSQIRQWRQKLEGFKKSSNRFGKFPRLIMVLNVNFRGLIMLFCILPMVIYRYVPRHSEVTVIVHYLSSLLFFLTLAFFSLCLFTQTHLDREAGFPDPHRKIKRNKVYKWCGWIIVGCAVLLDIYECVSQMYPHKPAIAFLKNSCLPVLWLETIMAVCFGISWFVKGGGWSRLNDRKV